MSPVLTSASLAAVVSTCPADAAFTSTASGCSLASFSVSTTGSGGCAGVGGATATGVGFSAEAESSDLLAMYFQRITPAAASRMTTNRMINTGLTPLFG